MCILCVYTLLKVVSYYDFSVLSSVRVSDGFSKKSLDNGGLYPFYLRFLEFCLTLQSP